jgi:hypothetical protein
MDSSLVCNPGSFVGFAFVSSPLQLMRVKVKEFEYRLAL